MILEGFQWKAWVIILSLSKVNALGNPFTSSVHQDHQQSDIVQYKKKKTFFHSQLNQTFTEAFDTSTPLLAAIIKEHLTPCLCFIIHWTQEGLVPDPWPSRILLKDPTTFPSLKFSSLKTTVNFVFITPSGQTLIEHSLILSTETTLPMKYLFPIFFL